MIIYRFYQIRFYFHLPWFKGGVLSQDTSVTPYIHATYFPPVSTTICHKFHRNLPQSTTICRSPPKSAKVCRSCQVRRILLNFARSRDNAQYSTVNLATKLT